VVALVADLSKQPPDQIDGYFLTKKDVYHDPDGMPNLVALQSNIDTQRDLGFLKDTIDVRKYADLAPIAEAAKRVAIAEGK
jgi:NitT/TauT family transport system substrate-binding protein